MKIFSGIRPSGQIHIGNYLGAIKQWTALQEKNDCIFCIVDLHAITTPYQPQSLQKEIQSSAIAYLAAGLNPKKSIIFVQSQVSEHSELAWLLGAVASIGDLQRMTQFKEKSAKYKKNINAGLLSYPILMAADILLYNTDVVPVGKDQAQHVELTREISRRFNNRFGKTFKMPGAMLAKSGAKIMSLTQPNKKMSKTDEPESYISLFDNPQQIKTKIMSATTDSEKEIKLSAAKPGISNLLTVYSLFADKPIKQLEKEFSGKGYAQFKKSLADLLIKKLEVFRAKKKQLAKNPASLEKILNQGAAQAQKLACQKMREVRAKMGLK